MKSREPTTSAPLSERHSALIGLGRTLLGSSNSWDLYQSIYVETAKVIELSGFLLSLYDDQSDIATVVFSVDGGKESKVGLTYRGSDSEVIRTGIPTTLERQTEADAVLFPEDPGPDVTRSTLSVPLLWRNRVIGALTVCTLRADAYEAADSDLLGRLGDLAAVALENIRYVEELQQRSLEAEKLEEIGRLLVSSVDFDEVLERVSHATMDLLHIDGAGVWMHRDGYGILRASVGEAPIPVGTTWALSEAVAETVIVKGEPFSIDDVTSNESLPDIVGICLPGGSAISTPIEVGDRVVGALSAQSTKVKHFTDADVRTLGRLAAQASAALDNAELHASVQALSLTDALTGLSNRRQLQLHLEREVAAARRGRKLALVLFDLDSFKRYNDTHGHVVGDQILQAFAQVLSRENRAMNLVARYGGDEFVSVLSEGDSRAAQGYVIRIQEGVREHALLASHGVTVSFGLAEFKAGQTMGVEGLIQAADQSMYENKGAKR